jgi:fatty-acyl-CoA synthase
MASPFARPALASLADVEALETVALRERLAAANTYELIRTVAAEQPDQPAIVWLPHGRADDAPQVFSYRETFARITQTANLLHELGVRPGRPLSVLLPNLPETHFVLWGGSAAGQVNPVNPLLAPAQIAEIMTAAGSRVLVTTAPDLNADLWAKAKAVRQLLPQFGTLVVVGDGPIDEPAVRYGAELEFQPANRLVSGRVIAGEDVATYFHTGGTTGAPKLAQQTHWNQVCMAWITAHVLDCGPGDRFLVGLPLFHANAAIASGLNVLGSGGTIVLAGQNGFRDPDTMADFWRIVDRHKVTAFSAVPTILANLLDLPRDGCDVSSLRICLCGAAPLAVSLFRAFEAATGLKILEAYGMTESTLCSTINPRDGERRIGSVGIRVPFHRVKTALLDSEGAYLRDCEDGEVGVLLLKGDTVTPGYKQPQFNQGLWPQPGWLNSGDLARRDAQGYFWLTGRAKDLIIRGGHNIDPAVIEEALHRHPAVELAAAVGRPDPRVGEVPVAFVSLRPGMGADPEALREFARANVPERPAAPAYVRIIEKIPTTAVGKIFKPALREIVVRETLEEALAGTSLGGVAEVRVTSDKTRGIVARIELRLPAGASADAARAEVEAVLLRYPVTIDIVIAEPVQ